MQQTATVMRLLPNDKAELQVHRQTACGHDCSKCGGCGEMVTKPIRLTVKNDINVKVGETVCITGSTKQVLGLAAVVYIVPFVLFFLFYGLAALVSLPIPGIWGGIGFFAGLGIALLVNNRQKNADPVYTISRL